MRPPRPRGPLGEALAAALAQPPGAGGDLPAAASAAVAAAGGTVETDDDVQASLTAMYELHYTGLDGVDERWEWDPDLLAARSVLEAAFEARLAELVPREAVDAPDVTRRLFALMAGDDGPSLSRFLERSAAEEQWREFLMQRSIYQLKEADPHAFAIPRLSGRAKVALVEIEADEFGGGLPERIHSGLFARTMRSLGLDDTPGAYADELPAVTLAHVNVMSLFGLHRRWRGALVGHLAAFEMTSSIPNRRYANGLRRLGYGQDASEYFDEHVEADAVHEQIAAHDMAGALVAAEPGLAGDVLFGARVALALDTLVTGHLLASWEAGGSSLRQAGEAVTIQ